ncbi:MAG: hypothetical protein E7216_11450 [Clostridium thermopalmarium]|uniref:hypothetical protein n=1 Tax=Clostridium thermopalmarium TaxID=29373 RepID=UPI002357989A|nr:hypothetical protein [Clostridium thermopalmarium]MBE6044830.1 hypothetical protein [Clostridium thermopalmarium]
MRINQEFITPIISATAVIIGSIIGATCTWITTNHSTIKTIEVENKIVEENRKNEELEKLLKFCENINIIRLDICNSLFQSIRTLKDFHEGNFENRYPISINRDYSRVVASLTGKFDLKELSYIYQVYGIIETLNKHISELGFNDKNGYELIKMDCELLLKKFYGENYKKIIELDIDKICYEELYNNEFMKKGYRHILKKLDMHSYSEKSKEKEIKEKYIQSRG